MDYVLSRSILAVYKGFFFAFPERGCDVCVSSASLCADSARHLISSTAGNVSSSYSAADFSSLFLSPSLLYCIIYIYTYIFSVCALVLLLQPTSDRIFSNIEGVKNLIGFLVLFPFLCFFRN